eukprot:jgi/Mesen1/10595/ME000852S09900
MRKRRDRGVMASSLFEAVLVIYKIWEASPSVRQMFRVARVCLKERLFRLSMPQARNFTEEMLVLNSSQMEDPNVVAVVLDQGPQGKPAIKRAIVVCPSSLVENWGSEVKKWLGTERLKALVIHAGTCASEAESKFADFTNGAVWPLLITSYELLRKHAHSIATAKPGLLVCDEGHRLKNSAGNKTIDALLSLSCPKRILLTGTPVQNDLHEFFAMVDFVNPNVLGPLANFKRVFADPIERSRDRTASDEERELGMARSQELMRNAAAFILRRGTEVNEKYLPPKDEYVVFCRLHATQVKCYEYFLRSKQLLSIFNGIGGSPLVAIGTLRKICNHPCLVQPASDTSNNLEEGGDLLTEASEGGRETVKAMAERLQKEGQLCRDSGKLTCLSNLLTTIWDASPEETTRERVVVVSNFTKTLDIIQALCDSKGWRCCRLDGTTEVSTRQSMVNSFNKHLSNEFVFLLSSKAGGCGINLIGANRLVLFDPDWNPATDAQATARVWREGQPKPVVIYRFLATGSIEEKIYQRQIVKGEVAAAVAAGEAEGPASAGNQHFTREELQELFTLRQKTMCDTYDILRASKYTSIAARWTDHKTSVGDSALEGAIRLGGITFVYKEPERSTVEF